LVGLIGLSLSLGAFVAGLVLSESDFSHQITSEIVPIRDVFSSIFFVSVGLMLDLTFVADFPIRLLGLSIAIMIIKILVIFGVALILKNSLRISFITGLILAQVGEFSFVIAQEGMQYNLIQADFYNAFLAASIFTMVVTPIFSLAVPKLSYKIKDFGKAGDIDSTKLKNHVIVVGYGINGRNLTRVLKETGIKYIIVELNPLTIKKCKDEGIPTLFGDATREDILLSAGIKEANSIVFAIADPEATKLGVRTAKRLNPNIYSIVRTRHVSEIEALKKYGADTVIPEEFETSLEIFKKVLTKYHIPLNVIQQQENLIRTEGYSFLWKQEDVVEHKLTNINRMLAEGLTETYYVDEKNPNIGKSLKEIDLRNHTDATIIAIVNEKETITNPGADVVLNPKDTLVLYGTHKSVDEAINLLDK
jgi:CPA2 family monovalent cation:H+ antiporter-2